MASKTPRKLYDNGVLIRLRAPGWSATKADPRIKEIVSDATGADTHALSGSKYIVPRDVIKGIKSPVDRARRAITDVSISWSSNKSDERGNRKEDALWLCPTMELPGLEKILRDCKQEREKAIKEFLSNYHTIIAERRITLGSLFDDFDYPDEDWIKDKFSWDVDIVPLWSMKDIENDLRIKLPSSWAKEQVEHARMEEAKRIANAVSSAAQEVVDFIGETVSKLEEYSPTEGDKRKGTTFKSKTLFNSVPKLRARLESLNDMLGDDALTETVSALKDVESTLDGVDPQEIRDSKEMREAVAEKLKAATEKAKPATDRMAELMG